MLIYFGFTNCPDICPEELDKMAEVLDTVSTFKCFAALTPSGLLPFRSNRSTNVSCVL